MLTVEAVTTRYGGITAVRAASLSVAEGEMVALLGRNGAGKTTLLNTICGLLKPAEGRILFRDEPIANRPCHAIARRGLVQVPEGRRILGPLSVEENLDLGRQALGGRSGNRAADLERIFALFPILAERRRQAGGSLSGGQQQMLAIGRALMGNPTLLLLDEPSLGLAPVVSQQVFAALRRLKAEGLTILLVEQNARRALEVTDRAYVMEQGSVVQEGPSAELARDPKMISHYLGEEAAGGRPAA